MTLELAAKSFVIVLFAGCLCLVMRRSSAAVRHFVWLCAFAGLAMLPFAEAGLPTWHLLPSKHIVLVPPPDAVVSEEAPLDFDPLPAPVVEAALPVDASAIAASIWRFVAVGFVLYGALGMVLAWRLGSKSSPFPDVERFDQAQERSAVRRRVRGLLAGGGQVRSAMTWGLIRPTVLMPSESQAWPGEVSDSVLMHEFAHVRRLDWAVQTGALLVCACYWFNPAVWLAFSLLKREAETAADEFVISRGRPASMYASDLLTVARLACRSPRLASPGVSFMNHSRIDRRVSKILSGGARLRGLTRIEALAGVVAALVLSAAIAVASPTPGAAVISVIVPPAVQTPKLTRTHGAPKKTHRSAKPYRLSRLSSQGRLRAELQAQRAELNAERAKLEAERFRLESERQVLEADMRAHRADLDRQLKNVDRAAIDAARAELGQAQKRIVEAQGQLAVRAAKADAELQGQKQVQEGLLQKLKAEMDAQRAKAEMDRADQKNKIRSDQDRKPDPLTGQSLQAEKALVEAAKSTQLEASSADMRRAVEQLEEAQRQFTKGAVSKSQVLQQEDELIRERASLGSSDAQILVLNDRTMRVSDFLANAKRSQADVETAKKLYDEGIITKSDLLEKQYTKAVIDGMVKAAANKPGRDAFHARQKELLSKQLQIVQVELAEANRRYSEGVVSKLTIQELAARIAELKARIAQIKAQSKSADVKAGH